MFCGNCGNKLKKGDVFCQKCGSKVLEEETKSPKRTNKEKKEKVKEEIKDEEVKKEVKEKVNKERALSKKQLIIILGSVGGLFLIGLILLLFLVIIPFINNSKKIDTVWGNKYYVYLSEVKEKDKYEEAGIPDSFKKGNLAFYDIGDKNPVMVLSYEKDKKTYSNIYYVKDGKVNVLVYNDSMEVVLLYNILKKEYDYYSHTNENDVDTYKEVSDVIEEYEEKEKADSYTFKKSDKVSTTLDTGEELSISKYEETFVEVPEKDVHIDYSRDMDIKELKENIKDGVKEYKEKEEIVDKKVTKNVEDKIKDVEDTKKEIERIEASKFTSGIKELDKALEYEVGLYQYNNEVYFSPFEFIGGYNVKELEAKNLPDTFVNEKVYNYLNNKLSYREVYSEEVVKEGLRDLYGNNYTYHRLTHSGPCSAFSYNASKGGYEVVGGCGGITLDYEPYYKTIITSRTDTSVVVSTLCVVPTEASDHYSAIAPYRIYKDASKNENIATLNNLSSLIELVKEKGTKFEISFDKDNGYYHFDDIKKISD